MKYPQAYVFLKSSIENDEDSIRRTIGAKVEVHFKPNSNQGLSTVDNRAKIVREVIEAFNGNRMRNAPYVVISTKQLGSMFALKYHDNIDEIAWIQSGADFLKIRSGLQGFKHYWLLLRAAEVTVKNYRRLDEILGADCPEFIRNHSLFSALDSHCAALYAAEALKAMRERLFSISSIGKYEI
jgi:hypothetical protein